MSVEGSVRERRRAETIREIKDAALHQLAESGAGSLSLRGVARAIGMTVQSIYHYFDSREALLTALLVDAHEALAGTVQAAADATRGRPAVERRVETCMAFRRWALANRPAFLLIYGTPVPGFDAKSAMATGRASLRLATPFAETTFDGWTPQQLAALQLPPGGERLAEVEQDKIPLPTAALALFVELRARMHGLVMLELLGHLYPFMEHGEVLFAAAVRHMSDELDALQHSRT